MPKIRFNCAVKYNDGYHAAGEKFDVDEVDVPELERLGGVVFVEPADTDEKAPAPDTKKHKSRRG